MFMYVLVHVWKRSLIISVQLVSMHMTWYEYFHDNTQSHHVLMHFPDCSRHYLCNGFWITHVIRQWHPAHPCLVHSPLMQLLVIQQKWTHTDTQTSADQWEITGGIPLVSGTSAFAKRKWHSFDCQTSQQHAGLSWTLIWHLKSVHWHISLILVLCCFL